MQLLLLKELRMDHSSCRVIHAGRTIIDTSDWILYWPFGQYAGNRFKVAMEGATARKGL